MNSAAPERSGPPAARALALLFSMIGASAAAATASFEPAFDGGVPAPQGRCGTCHAAMLAKPVLHDGVADCLSCHLRSPKPGPCADDPQRGWRLKRGATELCKSCHELKGATELHGTIRNSGCKSCHDPHSSVTPKLLKRPRTEQLCKHCHQFDPRRYGHAPVLAGDCTECHDPHVGQGEPLLRERREQVCLRCHELDGPGSPTPFVHAPVAEGDCLDCHQAHGATRKHLVTQGPVALCLSCHDGRAGKPPGAAAARTRLDLGAPYVHQPVKERCDHCHVTGHASAWPKLLKASQPALCTGCHAKTVAGKAPLHSSLKAGGCTACHDAHASPRKGLLTAAPGAALCFQCHDDEVQKRAQVHRPVAEGKCEACHAAHGSKNPAGLVAPEQELCTKCHDLGSPPVNTHAVLSEHGCLACHDAHGCGNAGLLIKPATALCVTCHEKQKDGAHVAPGTSLVHKVSGVEDPLRPGTELGCTSCHRPHGSDSPKLLLAGNTAPASCMACHTGAKGPFSRQDLIRRPPAQR